mmetsp:Transcript_42765/g.103902  ORF Transcript_42765/g.103902 Transcript_42765/m.103902 type:complete len:643 (-) Transcript_42765:102-2030(-)
MSREHSCANDILELAELKANATCICKVLRSRFSPTDSLTREEFTNCLPEKLHHLCEAAGCLFDENLRHADQTCTVREALSLLRLGFATSIPISPQPAASHAPTRSRCASLLQRPQAVYCPPVRPSDAERSGVGSGVGSTASSQLTRQSDRLPDGFRVADSVTLPRPSPRKTNATTSLPPLSRGVRSAASLPEISAEHQPVIRNSTSLPVLCAPTAHKDARAKKACSGSPIRCRTLPLACREREGHSATPIQQLRSALVRNAVRVVDMLKDWDPSGSGVYTRAEFCKAIWRLGSSADKGTIDSLFDAWDFRSSGKLSLRELHQIFHRGGQPPQPRKQKPDAISQAEITPVTADDAGARRSSRLRHTCATRGQGWCDTYMARSRSTFLDMSREYATGASDLANEGELPSSVRMMADEVVKALLRQLHAADSLGNGRLTRTQFCSALMRAGSDSVITEHPTVDGTTSVEVMSEAELNQIFDVFDHRKYGSITINEVEEVLHFVVHGSRTERSAATNLSPLEQLRQALDQQPARAIDLFRNWDLDGDGELSKAEFCMGLKQLGMNSSAFGESLFDTIDEDASGGISFKKLHRTLRRVKPQENKAHVVEDKLVVTNVPKLRRELSGWLLTLNPEDDVLGRAQTTIMV